MGAAEQITQEIFQVIEGGTNLGTPAQIIQFTSDNGQKTYEAVQKTYYGSNGTSFNYWVYAFYTAVGSLEYAASAGAAFLTFEVGTLGAFLAPALGLTTGYAMYNLTPEFWDRVGKLLSDAGETVGGKVVAFMNDNGIISFHPEVIEILKDALVETGVFDFDFNAPEYSNVGDVAVSTYMNGIETLTYLEATSPFRMKYDPGVRETILRYISQFPNTIGFCRYLTDTSIEAPPGYGSFCIWLVPYEDEYTLGTAVQSAWIDFYTALEAGSAIAVDCRLTTSAPMSLFVGVKEIAGPPTHKEMSGINANGSYPDPDALQDGAIYPDPNYFPDLYPDWQPQEFPDIGGQQLPDTYPLQYPDLLPSEEPYQDDSQNPDTEMPTLPDEVVETITDPANDPSNDADSHEDYVPDPDPQPTPDPIDPVPNPDPYPDPIEPDPPIPPTPVPPIPVPPLPTTVSSNKLFTVYNPSQANLDQLGGYLWDNDLIDILKKIWQNPLDGIISLIQVYCTPPTGGSHNIILGYVDSGVSAPVVSSQFVTIDCGSVTVPERNKNCTDYIPYTSMELYLPFVGIVEIDTNEFMGGTISVKYKVDVYTGTCLAEVKCVRQSDMVNGAILYTYSGNCSQQLPLTSGDARGVLSTLVSAAGAGISIASGGSFGVMAGARMISANIGREMLHVSHSGNLSANAGIMGQKKPYLIINRDRPYNANSYNKFYGFPCNKTVFLGNYFGKGFVRMKAGRLRTKATQGEKDEILELLKEGVIM